MKFLKLQTCVIKPLAAVRSRMLVLVVASLALTSLNASELRWEKLPPLPNTLGVAGAFAGVGGEALLVAGGANFPDKKPWEGGTKVWHDEVFVLEKPDGAWRSAGRLPLPLGYGVTVSHKRGLVCFGGSSPTHHHGSAIVLRWSKGRLETELLLGMPEPRANLCGALVGNTRLPLRRHGDARRDECGEHVVRNEPLTEAT